jgi:RNA polymerase sigma-70 factor (ECF subfamily)
MRQLSEPPGVIGDNDADLALVKRFRKGDKEAFTELVIRYQRPIYNAAFWILRRAEDARDVAQTVFLRIAERLDEYDEQYKFFSWVYRIAVNEALNVLRRQGREEPLDEEIDYPGPVDDNPEHKLRDVELSARIKSALMAMSVNDRTVLTLRHFSELNYQEIAEILELDEKTVKSRLHEARQRLREMLKDFGPD